MLKFVFSRMVLVFFVFRLFGVVQVFAQTSDLNGTWVANIGDYTQMGNRLEMTFNNGNFESTLDGNYISRGIYTASNGRYTTQTTHIFGDNFYEIGLESRWYSQEQIRDILVPIYRMVFTLEDANALVDYMFILETGTYSVSGNILTMKKDDEVESFSFTRK